MVSDIIERWKASAR